MNPRRLAAALMAAGFLLAACGNGDDAATLEGSPPAASTGSPAASGIPAGDAQIEITSPAEGATIKVGELNIAVDVSDFDLVDKIGQKAQEGEGHIVYYLGAGYEIPVDPERPANIGGQGAFTSYMSHKPSYDWENAPPGQQTITVQLVNNDHTPLAPPRSDQVTVTISPE
jgi:hypothetical protein